MNTQVNFYDYKPKEFNLYEAVVDGFSKSDKMIPPKFFYDARGSQLFAEICDQPEYYLPDVEKKLLSNCAAEIVEYTGIDRVILEPGAGDLAKIRLLLNELKPSAYVPMDISSQFLLWASENLAKDFPWLNIHATCVDFTHSLPLPDGVPNKPRLVFFPGSSLGNFHKEEALEFLSMIRSVLGRDGMLLIGVDTKKSAGTLNAAYNDAAGVTAEFNLNVLWRIRNELKADCNPHYFEHHAFYNSDEGRVEMHLISQKKQAVRINGHRFNFESGETVHTECSYKYTPEEFIELAGMADLAPVKYWVAEDGYFGIYLLN